MLGDRLGIGERGLDRVMKALMRAFCAKASPPDGLREAAAR
jgi:hypothetical protein